MTSLRSTRTFVLAVRAGRSAPGSRLGKAVSMRRRRALSAGSRVAADAAADDANTSSAATHVHLARPFRCFMAIGIVDPPTHAVQRSLHPAATIAGGWLHPAATIAGGWLQGVC